MIFWISCILMVFFIFNFVWQLTIWLSIKNRARPFEDGWQDYQTATLFMDDEIYPALLENVSVNEELIVNMFLWGAPDNGLTTTHHYDLDLALDWHHKNVSGLILLDSINLHYQTSPQQIRDHAIVQALPQMQVVILNNALTPPNNLLYWIVTNPWLHEKFCEHSSFSFFFKLIACKISSNHQKIIIQKDKQIAWIGSRNFQRLNWMNQDSFIRLQGNITDTIAFEMIRSTKFSNFNLDAIINPYLDQCKNHAINHLKSSQNLQIKVIRPAEYLPTILHLIENSVTIYLKMNMLAHNKIIQALNRFVQRGGKLSLILDPNNYIFQFKLPLLPNIIPLLNIHDNANIKLANTQHQMHSKDALFILEDSRHFFISGSANWTVGALTRFSYNDLGVLLTGDENLYRKFLAGFDKLWEQSKSREEILATLSSSNKLKKYCLAKLMLWSGINPW